MAEAEPGKKGALGPAITAFGVLASAVTIYAFGYGMGVSAGKKDLTQEELALRQQLQRLAALSEEPAVKNTLTQEARAEVEALSAMVREGRFDELNDLSGAPLEVAGEAACFRNGEQIAYTLGSPPVTNCETGLIAAVTVLDGENRVRVAAEGRSQFVAPGDPKQWQLPDGARCALNLQGVQDTDDGRLAYLNFTNCMKG